MAASPDPIQFQLPEKIAPILGPPRGSVLYRALYGGRGSAKSFSAATVAAIWGAAEPIRVLCTREYQSSIRESFLAELKGAIAASTWLTQRYDVGTDYLRSKSTGSQFIFRGLRRNIQSIRSLARIDLTIVEEAEDVPEESWLALEPTVFRNPNTEVWALWNPNKDGSPVDQRFRKRPPKRALIAEVNWNDNPFFPPHMEQLRRRDQERLDPNTYAHIWDGAYLVNSNAQIFANKWKVKLFEPSPSWDGPYQGGDFGFSMDPTAAVRCYIGGDILYVSHEAGGLRLELDQTGSTICQKIPDYERYVSRWDSSAPGSISMIQRHGLPKAVGVEKWPGSVEDGIRFLHNFKRIIVHPRCVELIKELRLYSYEVDRLTNDILPVIVDAHNHYIDSLRYAVAPLIRKLRPAKALFGVYGNAA